MIYKKHILFIFRSLGTGGSQKIQAFVANACIKNGYDVTILSMSKDECSLDIDSNIIIKYIDYDDVTKVKSNPIKYLFKRLKYLIRFRMECKSINPDLICVFLIDVVRLTVLALKGTKYPIVASERGDPSQFSRKKISQYNYALNKCIGVVYQLKEAANYYKVKPNVIQEVIPNPSVDRNNHKKINKKNTSELFVFGAGRLTKQKRFDVLIDAYSIVKNKYPEYRLKIYGDGIEMDNLKKQVFDLGLSKQVDFMGNVKNIFQDVNEKSIFVLTSDFEGIPNVLTEALINDVPCIATDCSPGGARLLLDNGKCGEIVERGNPNQIATAIIKYIENWEYAKEKSAIGKKYIKTFEPNIIENKWIDLFKRIINND